MYLETIAEISGKFNERGDFPWRLTGTASTWWRPECTTVEILWKTAIKFEGYSSRVNNINNDNYFISILFVKQKATKTGNGILQCSLLFAGTELNRGLNVSSSAQSMAILLNCIIWWKTLFWKEIRKLHFPFFSKH